MAAYWLLRLGALLTRLVPLGVAYALGVAVLDLAWLGWPGGRRRTLANMRVVLGPGASDTDVHRTARRSFRQYGRYLVDFLRFPNMAPEEVRNCVTVEADSTLLETLATTERGIIYISMHFGNWDLAGAWLAQHRPLHVIAETFEPPQLNDYVQGTRARLGLHVYPMERSPVGLFRSLRRGESVAILLDRPGEDGEPVTFFGRRAWLPGGAARIALRSGALLSTGVVARLESNRYLGQFDIVPEIELSGDEEEDVRRLTQALVTNLERYIRARPDQWYMFRTMWPEG